jgi:hypothetical protein
MDKIDHALMKDIAHFKQVTKKVLRISVDITRLVHEPDYARRALNTGEESADEELVMLSLRIKSKLGVPPRPPKSSTDLSEQPLIPSVASLLAKKPDLEATGKYVLGLRGGVAEHRAATPAEAQTEAAPVDEEPPSKYLFGARG